MDVNLDTAPLEALAANISKQATIITNFLRDNNLQQPSLSPNGPSRFPAGASENVLNARSELIYAARQLQFLALGPIESVQWFALTGALDTVSLRWLHHYNIPSSVPLDRSISYKELSDTLHLSERTLTRIVKHAMTNNIFAELTPGQISHTSLSIQLAQPGHPIRGVVGHQTEVVFPAASKMVAAHERFGTDDPLATHAPFQLAFNTNMRALDWIANDPVASSRFAESMKGTASSGPFNTVHTLNSYDWAGLGAALIVDVGGSAGQVAKAIAKSASQLQFIVQDKPSMVFKGGKELEAEFENRIDFQAHDFFEPNPILEPEVFLLRLILHDWPDQDAINIIKPLVPSMGHKTRILINDVVIPPAGTIHPLQEKYIRNVDMMMMSMFNSLERTLDEWRELLRKTDPGLRIISVEKPPGSGLSMIEIMKVDLNGEKT